MIFLLLFGYGITLDAGVMDIVILDESNSQSGLQLQENFAHSPNFRSIRPGRVPKPGV